MEDSPPMVLALPSRPRTDAGGVERPGRLDAPGAIHRRPLLSWVERNRRLLTFGTFVFAVLAFSGAWAGGALVLDGRGMSLYVRLALDHLGASRTVPYWLPDLWGGAPVWAVIPSLPVFLLVPLATALGPDLAVKVGILALQVLGACGAHVLARSLWRSYPAGVTAGVVFALQPLVVSHGALAGSLPALAVMSATPWFAWALRRGFRGDGPGWLALAGLLGGFAVVMHAGFALGLVLLGAGLAVAEVGRARTAGEWAGPARRRRGRLVVRAGAVVAVALGASAYRLLPFASLHSWFVRPPAGSVRAGDVLGGDRMGREIGTFFGRGGRLSGSVSVDRDGLLGILAHMGWACLALSLLSVVVLARRDRDSTLTAILLSATLGVWMSTGALPLASGGPADRDQVVPFVLAGLVAGLLLGALIRQLRLGRWGLPLLAGALGLLVVAPYLTPFDSLQGIVPLLADLGTPRLYAVAPLALALGAAYPVALAWDWADGLRSPTTPAALPVALSAAMALAVLGVFLVDTWPARSYYRVRPPATAPAYDEVAASLTRAPGRFRVAPTQVDPTASGALLDAGRLLSIGWPDAVAGRQVWRLTAEALDAPSAYRDRASGLLATAFFVAERTADKGTGAESVPAIDLVTNPRALPMVRAYTHAVAMAADDLTPALAVALAHRNVGVFTGSPTASPALAATTVVDVRSTNPCNDGSGARIDPGLASQLGVACELDRWLAALPTGFDLLPLGDGVGATFRATTDRLQGVSVFLDRTPDRAELALHEVLTGGSLGPALTRGKAVGTDEFGLVAFTFDPITASAGKDYAFVLGCVGCPADKAPRLVVGHAADGSGDLLAAGTLRRDRVAAFAPIYEPVVADAPSTTSLDATTSRAGHWRIRANGSAPALVVVAEAWFPGWEARVDGAKVAVVPADGGLLGVAVDAGDHVITLEFRRPAAATTGRLITGATLLIVAGQAIRGRRRRRRTAPVAYAPVAVPSRPAPEPLLEARVLDRPHLDRATPRPSRPAPPPTPADEPHWDEVVKPQWAPPGEDAALDDYADPWPPDPS